MAIMIPSVISPEVKSSAERKIFEWFQNAPGTDKWIVLHSLGITTHNKVIYGETDFLVLAPQLGIFALEVKGGRVKRENGIWYFTNRYGSESSYADELFNSYHYPARYKNQLRKGDIFIYYQGNRYDKSQRYYFGVGSVGEIQTTDGENYYAKLLDCQQFGRKVPIYLPDGGYIEQLGFETVRKSLNPPWQSSIRPLSQEAYDYILKAAGIQLSSEPVHQDSIDVLKDKLKLAVRDFYVEGNSSAIHRIESIASAIGRATSTSGKENEHPRSSRYSPTVGQVEKLSRLLDYCKTMRMSYSYKPILILALLHYGDQDGCISIENAAVYFREYYSNRKAQGLAIEKKQCIYLRDDVTDAQIIANLLSNPVKALISVSNCRETKRSPQHCGRDRRGQETGRLHGGERLSGELVYRPPCFPCRRWDL